MTRHHLLMVDDDEVDAIMVKRALRRAGLDASLVTAANGHEAISRLRGQVEREPFDKPFVILLDLNMPRMNGFEFLGELRGDIHLKHHVVFVFTSSEDERDRDRAYRQHVAGFITKSNAGRGFERLADLLRAYWTTVELPPAALGGA